MANGLADFRGRFPQELFGRGLYPAVAAVLDHDHRVGVQQNGTAAQIAFPSVLDEAAQPVRNLAGRAEAEELRLSPDLVGDREDLVHGIRASGPLIGRGQPPQVATNSLATTTAAPKARMAPSPP